MAKLKNVDAFCGFCSAVTKMELAGDTADGPDASTRWAKCKRCKQKMIIDLNNLIKEVKLTVNDIKTENSVTYSPLKAYKIGDTIYHEKWQDFGIIVSKATTSGGRGMIAVDFQNNGKKELLETFSAAKGGE